MIETHPDIRIFGMTAYTVRDRGTAYERDMANPETDELFSRKIISRYDLCDAMIEGVLPKPVYKSAYVNLIGAEQSLEEKVAKLNKKGKKIGNQKQLPPKPREYFSISYDKEGFPKVSTLVDMDPYNLQEIYDELMRD